MLIFPQVYNIPKQLGDSDIRCIVLDNHRPTHLANIHSSHNVIVLENEDSINSEIPANGSDLSGAEDAEDTSNDDEDDDDEDDDEEDIDDDEVMFTLLKSQLSLSRLFTFLFSYAV